MKKSIKIIIALVVGAMVVLAISWFNQPKKQVGDKTIYIQILDCREDQKEILNASFRTDATLLSNFLIELKEAKEIQLAYENGDFGMFITGMGKDELIMQDQQDGCYWSYDSLNNSMCIKDTYCTSASSLTIEDGNEFIFVIRRY